MVVNFISCTPFQLIHILAVLIWTKENQRLEFYLQGYPHCHHMNDCYPPPRRGGCRYEAKKMMGKDCICTRLICDKNLEKIDSSSEWYEKWKEDTRIKFKPQKIDSYSYYKKKPSKGGSSTNFVNSAKDVRFPTLKLIEKYNGINAGSYEDPKSKSNRKSTRATKHKRISFENSKEETPIQNLNLHNSRYGHKLKSIDFSFDPNQTRMISQWMKVNRMVKEKEPFDNFLRRTSLLLKEPKVRESFSWEQKVTKLVDKSEEIVEEDHPNLSHDISSPNSILNLSKSFGIPKEGYILKTKSRKQKPTSKPKPEAMPVIQYSAPKTSSEPPHRRKIFPNLGSRRIPLSSRRQNSYRIYGTPSGIKPGTTKTLPFPLSKGGIQTSTPRRPQNTIPKSRSKSISPKSSFLVSLESKRTIPRFRNIRDRLFAIQRNREGREFEMRKVADSAEIPVRDYGQAKNEHRNEYNLVSLSGNPPKLLAKLNQNKLHIIGELPDTGQKRLISSSVTEVKDTCIDVNSSCFYWAWNGECHNNPTFMTLNCCASCITYIKFQQNQNAVMHHTQNRV